MLLKGGICNMAGWAAWVALLSLSVVAQWSPGWYGALIGGVLAVVGAVALMNS